MADTKDTIYIDVDDEITSIIDKVRTSKHKIIALVLPKRAATLQSIVNMKLLKRTSEEDKKQLVLITSEAGLLPLAGAVGLHVAKTLQSKPAIPPPPDVPTGKEAFVEDIANEEEEKEPDEEPDIDSAKTVGELAGETAVAAAATKQAPLEEMIDVDNTEDEPAAKGKKGKKDKKGSKIKIPNFDKFRLRLFLGVLAFILLIVLWIFAFKILPKATVTIQTDTVSVNPTVSFTANTAATTVDSSKNVVPAEIKDVKETGTQNAQATGQKNNGNKAAGKVTLSLTDCSQAQVNVPAGTAVTTNGLTFITQNDASMSRVIVGNTCKNDPADSSATVNVIAQVGGSNYNVAPTSYAVAGFSNVSGQGNQMSGGTDNVITILSQADVDGAKAKLTASTTQAQTDLETALKKDNELPLVATMVADTPVVTTSANVGDQVSSVTVTVVSTYHMLGVKQTDLEGLLGTAVKSQINTSKQKISDYGLSSATFASTAKASATNQNLTMQSTVTAGALINTTDLKKQIAGKKEGDVKQLINALPSVQSVNVSYSPFWVSQTTHNTGHITIVVQQAQAKSNGGN